MLLENRWRISETVLFLLSVKHSTIMAQLPGPKPSYVAACSWFAPTLHPSPSPTQILSIHRTLYVVLRHTGGTRSRERRLQLDIGF